LFFRNQGLIYLEFPLVSHEEAETRLLLHALDASKEGFKKVMVRTVDTDVVVLAITYFAQLSLNELWIAFGVLDILLYTT